MIRKLPISFVLAILCAAAPLAAQSADGRIWSGVFTASQAERGKANFTTSCVRCHGPSLTGVAGGNAPALTGARFKSSWENENLYSLFTKIRDTMPPNFGTSLTDEAKLDVLAYILQVNSFPVGAEELKINARDLESIGIVPRGGAGAEIPNFALVQVVGCLAQGPGNTWMLTRTSAPVATPDPSSTLEALKQAQAQPLGTETFRLVSIGNSKPATHIGQKMEAKGLLYRESDEARLNLTSLEMVASSCANE